MSMYSDLLQRSPEQQQLALQDINQQLAPLSAAERIAFALAHLPGNHMLSSSFGIQAAVMLHLCTQADANMPIVLTDTGYLFPETYQFIDQLKQQLALNLKVYRAHLSPAWQEARFGKLWQTEAGLSNTTL